MTTEPPIYTKDDIEDMLDVAALLDIEFDPAALSTLDPDRMSPAEVPMVAEAVKQRIHDGWMREKARQEKKAGRHGRGRLTPYRLRPRPVTAAGAPPCRRCRSRLPSARAVLLCSR